MTQRTKDDTPSQRAAQALHGHQRETSPSPDEAGEGLRMPYRGVPIPWDPEKLPPGRVEVLGESYLGRLTFSAERSQEILRRLFLAKVNPNSARARLERGAGVARANRSTEELRYFEAALDFVSAAAATVPRVMIQAGGPEGAGYRWVD